MVTASSETFLGLDLSTQQLKVIALDDKLRIVHEEVVDFDKDLSEFGTKGGVKRHKDALTVTVPTLLWVKAFDLLLERMKSKGFPFENVVCVSGTGQQHGSVFWRKGTKKLLKNLDSNTSFYEQLKVFCANILLAWQDQVPCGTSNGISCTCCWMFYV